MTTLLGRFVSPAEIVAAGSDWSSMPYENRAKQLADDRLYLGLEAREKLEVFLEDGSISLHDADQFCMVYGVFTKKLCPTPRLVCHLMTWLYRMPHSWMWREEWRPEFKVCTTF